MKLQVNLTHLGVSDGVGLVRTKLATSPVVSLSPQQFADKVGRNNFTYNSSLHLPTSEEGINLANSNHTATSWQILSLDFDGKIIVTPQKVIDRLQDLIGLPNFIYTTKRNPSHKYSMQNAERYRVVYILEKPIDLNAYTREKRRQYFNFFSGVFPSLDSATFDEARLFFGGEYILFEQYENFLACDLLDAVCSTYSIKVKSEKAFKKKLAESAPHTYKDQKNEKYIYNNINNSVFGKNLIKWGPEKWQEAQKQSPLLAKFFAAKEKILHPQLFMLYLTLMHIEGGVKRWRDAVTSNSTIDHKDKINKIHNWVAQTKKYRHFYEPTYRSVDPNVDSNFPNYLSQFGKNSKNTSTVIKDVPIIVERDIEVIRDDIRCCVEEYFMYGGKYLLKAPTGTGKSTTLLNLLKGNPTYRNGTVIAFPRHDLINEFGQQLKKEKIPFKSITELPYIRSKKLSNEIKNLYKRGFHSAVRRILHNISNKNTRTINKYEVELEDIVNIKNYVDCNDTITTYEGLILTTHQSFLYGDYPRIKRVIFDENPLDTLLQVKEIDYDRFLALLRKNDDLNETFADLINKLNSLYEDIHRLQKITVDAVTDEEKDRFKDEDFENLGYLLSAESIYPIFYEGKISKLVIGSVISRSFQNLMILSATASYSTLSKVEPNLKLVDLGKVKLKGRLLQFLARGYSKNTISKLIFNTSFKDFAENIVELVGNTIIASPSAEKLKEILNVNFNYHNTSGLNVLSEYDMIVFGTEFPPDYLMPVRADLLNITFSNIELDFLTCERYGVAFNLRTFKDETLREMQLEYMEELLLQTVGRSRLPIHKNRKVVVFAKIPLEQAEKLLTNKYDDILEEIYRADVTGSSVPNYNGYKPVNLNGDINPDDRNVLYEIFKDI